jgi:dTDP-4-amino-4,6-dideoxygalactose transaminase
LTSQRRVPFADLGSLHEPIRAEIDAAIAGVIDTNAYILGPDVEAFETEFAAYCEAGHCVGVASGTAALELAFEALELGPGDEVIVPANTFVATVMPLLHRGVTPVLVDCDPDTALVDVDAAAAAVSERTRAIVPVHLYGQPADMGPLLDLAAAHDLVVVEDAAQAHGARYAGRRIGSFGRATCFSFYPGKNLGALGDGGAVVTGDADLAERIRLLRDLGQARKYEHVVAGHNERLDTLQAAVLRVKLRHLDAWNDERRRAAADYAQALEDLPVSLPETALDREHVWHLYAIRCAHRDEVRAALDSAGIGTGIHYPVPVHLHVAFAALGHTRGSFPVAEAWSREQLSLPMFPGLDRDRVDVVADRLADALGARRYAIR